MPLDSTTSRRNNTYLLIDFNRTVQPFVTWGDTQCWVVRPQLTSSIFLFARKSHKSVDQSECANYKSTISRAKRPAALHQMWQWAFSVGGHFSSNVQGRRRMDVQKTTKWLRWCMVCKQEGEIIHQSHCNTSWRAAQWQLFNIERLSRRGQTKTQGIELYQQFCLFFNSMDATNSTTCSHLSC